MSRNVMARAAAAIFLLLVLSSCSEPTEVVLVVDADETVRARASTLAVSVTDGDGALVASREDPIGEGPRDVRFPQAIPLVPRGGDVSRRWALRVEARNPAGCVVASIEAEGGYVDGVSSRRELLLDGTGASACPVGPGCDACDDGLACTDQRCVDEYCVQDVVGSGCAIDGACVAAGDPMSGDPCRVCDPDRAAAEWSLAPGCRVAEVGRVGAGGGTGDLFGYSVAVSGDRIVVGSPAADPGGAVDAGAAYVVARRADGSWQLEATLLAPDARAGDQLGYSVAIDGDTIVVGAPYADAPDTDSGAVYVFTRTGTAARWAAMPRLAGSDGADYFGLAVAISGDRIVAGAPYDDAPAEAGAAYVFERTASGAFVELAPRLQAPEPEMQGFFGHSVAIAGSRILVGEYLAAQGTRTGAGAAHLFERGGAGVVHVAELIGSAPQDGAALGQTVAIDDTLAACGAPLDDRGASDGGAVLVFPAGGSATEIAALTESSSGTQMSLGLGVSAPYVAAGAPYDDPAGRDDAGVVYLFAQADGAWLSPTAVVARDAPAGAKLGRSVAIDGRWLVAGAPEEAPGGAVYLFEVQR